MELTEKDLLDYAWKHFSVIADQRIKTFNFYVILLAASTGVTLSVFERMNKPPVVLACAAMHMVFAAVFFIIDQRSRRLIQIPKKVLLDIEKERRWRLFAEDVTQMERFWNRTFSYTAAFRLAFLSQFTFGAWVFIDRFLN